MSKIVFVSLLQVVLTQYTPIARPYDRTNIGPGYHYLPDPERRNQQVRGPGTHFRSVHFNNYRLHSGQNEENLYRYQPSKEKDREVDHYTGGSDKTLQPKAIDEQQINLYSRSNAFTSDMNKTEYNIKSNSQQKPAHVPVRTNNKPTESPDISRSTSTSIELTVVPVLTATSVSLKTNEKNNSQFAITDGVRAGVGSDRGNVTFANEDNLKHRTLNIATTDNEVRQRKSENDEDRWIWSAGITSASSNVTTSTQVVLLDGDLDDRTSLTGDGCPDGKVKVKGACIPPHR